MVLKKFLAQRLTTTTAADHLKAHNLKHHSKSDRTFKATRRQDERKQGTDTEIKRQPKQRRVGEGTSAYIYLHTNTIYIHIFWINAQIYSYKHTA